MSSKNLISRCETLTSVASVAKQTKETLPHDDPVLRTTDPFSHQCRIVLHEKGMDFRSSTSTSTTSPEDLAVMNPYNTVPVLVERDLILHESNIINEYIDERFPHPQLMPADLATWRARACSCIVSIAKSSCMSKSWKKAPKRRQGTRLDPRPPDRDFGVQQAEAHAG